MAEMTAWTYSAGVRNLEEWAEVFRRLHIPHYEEARQYWSATEADGVFSEMRLTLPIYTRRTC